MEIKICSKCKKELPTTVEYFAKSKAGKHGLRADCKECNKRYYEENKEHVLEKSKRNYNKNKEHVLANQKKYREDNKEKIKNYDKLYREENKEEIKIKRQIRHKNNPEKYSSMRRKYYLKNKEKVKAINLAWYKRHPGISTIYIQTSRARANGLKATLTLEQWGYIKESFNHKCAYCGSKSKLEQDHFIALTNGGEYTLENIIPSCRSCNVNKRNKDFFEWYPQQKFYSKDYEKQIKEHISLQKEQK